MMKRWIAKEIHLEEKSLAKCKVNRLKCESLLLDLRGMRALRDTYGDMVGDGAILYAGRDLYRLDDHTLAIPWCSV